MRSPCPGIIEKIRAYLPRRGYLLSGSWTIILNFRKERFSNYTAVAATLGTSTVKKLLEPLSTRSSKSLSVLRLLDESHRLRTEPFVVTFDTVRAGGAASAFGSVHIDFGHQPFVNPAARHRFDHRGLDPEMHGDFQFRDNAPSLNVFL